MKNKGLIILVISVIIVVIVSILFVFGLKSLDYNLLSNKWYHYDYKTGYFDILYLNNNELSFYKPNSDNLTDEYSFCKSYTYNKINKNINLDCGKTLRIKSINSEKLTLEINTQELSFYKDINKSIDYEFNKYFNITKEKYKYKTIQALEIIKISNDKINQIIKEENYSKIIFMGNNCRNVECYLISDVIEKWISFSKDIYYVNSNDLTNETLFDLNKIDNKFDIKLDNYNNIYPVVYVVSNNKVIDIYEIKCDGFNCSNYYNK